MTNVCTILKTHFQESHFGGCQSSIRAFYFMCQRGYLCACVHVLMTWLVGWFVSRITQKSTERIFLKLGRRLGLGLEYCLIILLLVQD